MQGSGSPTLTELPLGHREGFVDVFRGLLIAHMALDHASLMFNAGRGGEELARAQPEFPAGAAQFLTRFTGVPVATGFCFMAGFMVAWTTSKRIGRGVADAEVTRRLLVRGLVLIAADTVLGGLPRAIQGFYSFMVLSCIGVSIIALSQLRRLAQTPLLAIALAILVLHPLLDVSALPLPLRALLYEPVREGRFRSLYPLVPWLGVVLLGFVVGRDAAAPTGAEQYHPDADARAHVRRWLTWGVVSLGLFFAVRALVNYGNAFPHAGVLGREFWYFAKYPPDLPFLTWGLAIVFGSLAAVRWICREGVPRLLTPLVVFGRVSFFFYLVHFYLLGPMRGITGAFGLGKLGLPGTYVVWLVLLGVMYWLCDWYHRKKTLRPNLVTRYL